MFTWNALTQKVTRIILDYISRVTSTGIVMATPVGQTTVKAKVVLLGEGQVGKTSIILRFVENKFNCKQVETSEVGHTKRGYNFWSYVKTHCLHR